jgi:hypothetical protein
VPSAFLFQLTLGRAFASMARSKPSDIKGKTLKREVALSSFQGLVSFRKRLFDLAQPCLAENKSEKRKLVNHRRKSPGKCHQKRSNRMV